MKIRFVPSVDRLLDASISSLSAIKQRRTERRQVNEVLKGMARDPEIYDIVRARLDAMKANR